jgi:hypothetical protein
MYGKIFRQMYKGSMSRQGWEAIVTMQQFIVLADRHGEVDMTLEAMAAETTIPIDVLRRGVETLSQPDPGSRSPDEDGRRIVLLDDHRDWGWRLVNYEKYRKLQSEEDRREYHRQYWHKRKTQQDSTDSIHAEVDADAEEDISVDTSQHSEREAAPRKARRSASKEGSAKGKTGTRIPDDWTPPPEMAAYAEQQLPGVDVARLAEEFTDYWRARVGEKARKLDWDATWRTWVRRSIDRYPMKRSASAAPQKQIRIDANGRQINA